MRLLFISFFLWIATAVHGQISGVVTDVNGQPLPGVNVSWEGTKTSTQTNSEGEYLIEKPSNSTVLVFEFPGYQPQRRSVIARKGVVNIQLAEKKESLGEVTVVGEAEATSVDLDNPELTFNISSRELRKAACCNLSETFETNSSVDLSFSDAVTGTKQIEMLGLAGKYVLIQRENIPNVRGLNSSSGLNLVPGPFVESIQLTKGLSSVINGYESLTGQINVELVKPDSHERFLNINGFVNQGARAELNVMTSTPINPNLQTAFLGHVSTIPFAQDKNDDGFSDQPTGHQINLMNRWKYFLSEEWVGQINVNVVSDFKESGQLPNIFDPEGGVTPWVFEMKNQRFELFGKNGWAPENDLDRSLGIIYSGSYQAQDAQIGSWDYSAQQSSLYLNSIFQDGFIGAKHSYKSGVSLQVDDVEEALMDSTLSFSNSRTEVVPGAFFEYTYKNSLRTTITGGIRVDYHNLFGWFVTPRLNIKYMPTEKLTLRIGGGRGQRTSNVFSENISGLASSRKVFLEGNQYGKEVDWNTGASAAYNFSIVERRASLTVDAFYSWFERKLVADYNLSPQELHFFFAEGSQSFSLLTQFDYEPMEGLDFRLAYKYIDSREAFKEGLTQSYKVPMHRVFANVSYVFWKDLMIDFTANWFGEKRLPDLTANPVAYSRVEYSPSFFTFNTKVEKSWKRWDVYLGVDNIFNLKQDNPIVSPDQPWNPYFDTNQVWGPIFGRMIYAGFNLRLGHQD